MDALKSKIMEIALGEVGVTEWEGPETNPRIFSYLNVAKNGLNQDRFSDETPWCAAYVSYVLHHAGAIVARTMVAKSHQESGLKIDFSKVEIGDVIILHNGNPSEWRGHVGFYINHDADVVWLLGGNQRGMVCIKSYDLDRIRKPGGVIRPLQRSSLCSR